MRTPETEFRAALKQLLDTAARENWPRELRIAAVKQLMAESGR